MTATRQKFEAWAARHFHMERLVGQDEYENNDTNVAWDAWRASRAIAIDDAAKVAEQTYEGSDHAEDADGADYLGENSARAIRALKELT